MGGDPIRLPVPAKGHSKGHGHGYVRLHQVICKQCWASLAPGQLPQRPQVTQLEAGMETWTCIWVPMGAHVGAYGKAWRRTGL